MYATSTTETVVTVRRLNVPVADVRGFQRSYETAVPELPADQVGELLRRRAPWSEMEALIDASAPHGFLLYSKNDAHPLMQAAGDDADCLWYLMGNHVLAERMFRHDPRALLYAPLRTVIWEDPSGGAWFTVDQPSTQFASLGVAAISDVAAELDEKLALLLRALHLDVPHALDTRPHDAHSANTDS